MEFKQEKKKIFHLTPHLGGGVGRVLLSWIPSDKINTHIIGTLDYANDHAVKISQKEDIKLISKVSNDEIVENINESDITLIHFWNHPLLYDFLIRNRIPKSRVIIWAHISGITPPNVFNKKLLDISDKFVFTTPISYRCMDNNPKLSCILSTGGVEDFYKIKHEPHQSYNIGYIGTVDFAKMHPKFIETISLTNADKIFIAGGKNEQEIFKNTDKRFLILGKLSDIKPTLSKLDVFAYMLNPNHYGTGEQVLQEAMAAGVVPVVMNNPCEKSLVEHEKTGLIANNTEEYISYINLLKTDIKFRQFLSDNAKNYAKDNFSINKLCSEWNEIFDRVMCIPKTSKKWDLKIATPSSYDIFMESLGDSSKLFVNKENETLRKILNKPEWNSSTKGTPKQYYSFLGGEELKKIVDLYK